MHLLDTAQRKCFGTFPCKWRRIHVAHHSRTSKKSGDCYGVKTQKVIKALTNSPQDVLWQVEKLGTSIAAISSPPEGNCLWGRLNQTVHPKSFLQGRDEGVEQQEGATWDVSHYLSLSKVSTTRQNGGWSFHFLGTMIEVFWKREWRSIESHKCWLVSYCQLVFASSDLWSVCPYSLLSLSSVPNQRLSTLAVVSQFPWICYPEDGRIFLFVPSFTPPSVRRTPTVRGNRGRLRRRPAVLLRRTSKGWRVRVGAAVQGVPRTSGGQHGLHDERPAAVSGHWRLRRTVCTFRSPGGRLLLLAACWTGLCRPVDERGVRTSCSALCEPTE